MNFYFIVFNTFNSLRICAIERNMKESNKMNLGIKRSISNNTSSGSIEENIQMRNDDVPIRKANDSFKVLLMSFSFLKIFLSLLFGILCLICAFTANQIMEYITIGIAPIVISIQVISLFRNKNNN